MRSSVYRFSARCRLPDANAYRLVFKQSRRSSDSCFTVLWRVSKLDRARLGLAIAKKHLRRAVDRNRVKRTVRESFRLHQYDLTGLDIVVLSKSATVSVATHELRASLERHWLRLKATAPSSD